MLFIASVHSNLAIAQSIQPTQQINYLSSQIEENKKEIAILEEKIAAQQKLIDQKRTESTSLKNQIQILDNQLTKIELDMSSTQKQIDFTKLEIQSTQLELLEIETKIETQKRLITNILKQLYQAGQKSYIKILLMNRSLSGFLDDIHNLKSINKDLGTNLNSFVQARNKQQEKKDFLSQTQKELEALQDKLESEKDSLNQNVFAKTDILAKTQSSELKYKFLLIELTRQYQAIENEIKAKQAEVEEKIKNSELSIGDTGEVILSWPVPLRIISATFHDPDYPFRRVFEHNGVDIKAAQGTPVKASASGYVARAKRCHTASCYSFVMIVHSGDMATVYGHLSGIVVGEDQFVGRGDLIGYSGGTPGTSGAGPFVTGPHLHFETRINGIPVDPIRYILR